MTADLSRIPQVGFFKKKGPEIDFDIFSLESLMARRKKLAHPLEDPHRVKFHNILYITEGQGSHTIDFQPYHLSRGSLLFIAQGQVHSFDVQSGVKGILVLFTQKYLEENLIHSDILSLYRLYNYHLHSPLLQPQETEGEAFDVLLGEMQNEYGHPDGFAKDEILRLLLKVVLLKAERLKRTIIMQQKNVQHLQRFNHFRECLEIHYQSTRSVGSYAAMLNISAKHLNTICRSIAGTTAKQCIDNFLVLESKRVLATSDYSVQEISYDFGFDEPTNFVKYFKKHTGYSPAQFRKNLIKES